jgi:hypothetical protein
LLRIRTPQACLLPGARHADSDCSLCRWDFFTDLGHVSHGLQWAELHRCAQSAPGGRSVRMTRPAQITCQVWVTPDEEKMQTHLT